MNQTERLLNAAVDHIAATLEQPSDMRAWEQLLIYCPRTGAGQMKSTPAMRARIRELMSNEQDDYDRAVECVLDDIEALEAALLPAKRPRTGAGQMIDAIAALAKRFWSVHPNEIQDLGITREQFYEREMRALFATQAARIEVLEARLDRAVTRGLEQVEQIATLEAALREIDNMAPATCEVTLAHQMADCARAALAPEQEK